MFEILESIALLGQSTGDAANESSSESIARPIVLALVFSGIGMAMLAAGFFVLTKILPFSLRKEIEEDQNTALAILISSIVLGLSLIIAAAIVG